MEIQETVKSEPLEYWKARDGLSLNCKPPRGAGFRSSLEMLPMHPGAGEREKRLNGNIWWEIKQHPFNPQLSHYPCCNYMPSNSKATRCSKPKPGITHLASVLGNEHSDSKGRAAFKLDKMKAFLDLFTKSGRIEVNQNIKHFLPNRGPRLLAGEHKLTSSETPIRTHTANTHCSFELRGFTRLLSWGTKSFT